MEGKCVGKLFATNYWKRVWLQNQPRGGWWSEGMVGCAVCGTYTDSKMKARKFLINETDLTKWENKLLSPEMSFSNGKWWIHTGWGRHQWGKIRNGIRNEDILNKWESSVVGIIFSSGGSFIYFQLCTYTIWPIAFLVCLMSFSILHSLLYLNGKHNQSREKYFKLRLLLDSTKHTIILNITNKWKCKVIPDHLNSNERGGRRVTSCTDKRVYSQSYRRGLCPHADHAAGWRTNQSLPGFK